MDAKKMNLDAPFLSETKPEDPNESENTKTTMMTTKREEVNDSFQETEHETLIRLLQDQGFGRVMEPSSVPCSSEEKPLEDHQHHTLIEESDIINALEMVSSTSSFSGNCSSSGVSEFEKNGERFSNGSRDDVILEYRDLIMSRFLPAAEAIAMKQKKEASRLEEERKKKQSIALQRVSMAINQDLNNDDDEDEENDDEHHNQGIHATVYSNDSKKPQLGFLPWSCSMNSLDALDPILSRVKTCQDVGVKSVNRKPQDFLYKTKSASPRILNSNKIMCNCQEIYEIPRSSKEKSNDIIQIPRTPSRLHRKIPSTDLIHSQETRFLAAEVKRRSNRNKNRSENLSVSQPPLPKTPTESWLVRTLPKCSAASSVAISRQAAGFKKKIEQKTNSQSINWETIVKTSYKHHDHVRYSKELLVVRPSRQHKF